MHACSSIPVDKPAGMIRSFFSGRAPNTLTVRATPWLLAPGVNILSSAQPRETRVRVGVHYGQWADDEATPLGEDEIYTSIVILQTTDSTSLSYLRKDDIGPDFCTGRSHGEMMRASSGHQPKQA